MAAKNPGDFTPEELALLVRSVDANIAVEQRLLTRFTKENRPIADLQRGIDMLNAVRVRLTTG